MNKELILRYKTEFDNWLNGGKLLIRNNDENIWINMTEVNWDMNYKTVSIIINDEYVEFRKALAEGKTLQLNEAARDADSNRGWVDLSCKSLGKSTHLFPINYYRIKPEEPKFKIGDFVKNESIGLIKQYSLSDLEYDKTATNINNWIKWKPSHKELCWFWSGNKLEEATLSKFHSYTKHGGFKTIYDSFKYCEPFLNSKPSWFK